MRDQLVAVKVFKVDAPPEQAEQIAEALQAVVQALPRHRGLVEFIAAGVERDTAYLVMAHSDVPSLDSRLKPGTGVSASTIDAARGVQRAATVPDSSAPPVDAEQALVIVRTLAEAMDAAHGRGIVHGGLHPRDIFVDERGACRAAGFGVASALERAGVKVPVRRPYSPPERLTSAPIEPAADRFALGAIAFELLTGRRIAGTGANAAARCTLSLPSADLGALRNALAAMLAEQPGHRPSTASAFATALSFALFPQGVARASAAATSAAAGSDRSPAAAARDDRRDSNTAGLGAGIGAGAIAAGANPPRDNDGPSPDDLELFTREGLFTGQPRQNALRWEPVEVENVVSPGEDPLELFTPESQVESQAAAEPARTPAETTPAVTDAQADAKRDTKTDADGDAAEDVNADLKAEASELPDTRPGSILGLSTTIVAPIEGAAPPARDERDEDDGEGHETTALPFVPIKADERISPASSRLHDSVLIDDHSRIDVLDRLDRQDRHDQHDRHDRHDRPDHLDRFDHLDDLDRLDREDNVDEADEAEESMTPAAAATAGVIAAAGVTSPAADLTHPSHASHAPHFDTPRADHEQADQAYADHAHTDRTRPRFEREADDQWIAPVAEPVTRPTSMLTNPQDTPDVGSSVRVVGLVLALGLAVGGAGGYLLGQRSSLRNASTFDQAAAGSSDTARPPVGIEQPGVPAPATGNAAGAPGASGAAAPGAGGAAGAARTPETPGRPGAVGGDSATAQPPAAAGGSAASGAASNAPAGASSTSGATRPAPTTGRLTVSSTPARAEVAIDGVRRGVTPLTLRDLPLGSHTVRVTRGGYAPETRRVTVSAGRPAESITFELEPTGPRTRPSAPGAGPAATAAAPAPERGSASGLGSLYVVSRPMGARVTIDGRLVGATPLLLTDISPGAHTITLEADGHKPWQTTVQVKMGERARVAGSLEEGR